MSATTNNTHCIAIITILIMLMTTNLISGVQINELSWKTCTPLFQASRTLYGLSLHECADACASRPYCVALRYWRVRKMCEIVNNTQQLEVTEGSYNQTCAEIHRDIIEEPQCACTNGETCANGNCEIKECPTIDLEHSDVLGNMQDIQSKVTVTCTFMSGGVVVTGTGTCNATGEWINLPSCPTASTAVTSSSSTIISSASSSSTTSTVNTTPPPLFTTSTATSSTTQSTISTFTTSAPTTSSVTQSPTTSSTTPSTTTTASTTPSTTTTSSTTSSTTATSSTTPSTTTTSSTTPSTTATLTTLALTTSSTTQSSTTSTTTTAPKSSTSINPLITADPAVEDVQLGDLALSFHDQSVPYIEAEEICKSNGQDLLKVDTPQKQATLVTYLLSVVTDSSDSYWIQGGVDVDGNWIYDNGTLIPIDHTHYWQIGQPDGQTCIRMEYFWNYKWGDHHCTVSYKFICETP